MRDVSLMGARITGIGVELSRGDRIHVTVIDRERPARVCWCHRGAVGILFESALSRRELAALAGGAAEALCAYGAVSMPVRRPPCAPPPAGPGVEPVDRPARLAGRSAAAVDPDAVLAAIDQALDAAPDGTRSGAATAGRAA